MTQSAGLNDITKTLPLVSSWLCCHLHWVLFILTLHMGDMRPATPDIPSPGLKTNGKELGLSPQVRQMSWRRGCPWWGTNPSLLTQKLRVLSSFLIVGHHPGSEDNGEIVSQPFPWLWCGFSLFAMWIGWPKCGFLHLSTVKELLCQFLGFSQKKLFHI